MPPALTRCAFLCLLALLAGCAAGPRAGDTPFAPGVDHRADAVDGVLVGNRLLAAGEFELALEAYTRAALQDGMTGEIYAGLGSANLGLGRLGQAERQLRRAVTYTDAHPETWNNLGQLLMERGDHAEAAQMFKRAYALDNGESTAIRDNLRNALALMDEAGYDGGNEQEFQVVPSGQGAYEIRKSP
ncbi:tetratricopeptide repeat protein [Pseudooceanicola aestuarii]|uniref:tetratricopeptide repeat protein n=1 Tax=Pseudooceanicola aestuarii TaxID=2697319 RepID=UPI0013CFC91B|nr:tetratricopeptide repeat protein [Pseudooceanicola aestuarii]